MTPRKLASDLVREVPVLAEDEALGSAARQVAGSGLPALPVVDGSRRLAGIFGERELFEAMFPGYLGQLSYAGFVPKSLDEALEKRSEHVSEPVGRHMNTERIEVGPEFSDAEVAETFLHHRVLIVPVAERGRVLGVVTRSDFFRALVERLT